MANSQTLDDREYLASLIRKNAGRRSVELALRSDHSMYCQACGDLRRMQVEVVHVPAPLETMPRDMTIEDFKPLVTGPWVFRYQCLVCKAEFTATLASATPWPAGLPSKPLAGARLAVQPERLSFRTNVVPAAVQYFLEQAEIARLAGAYSAAAAMYRAVVEQVLYDKGITVRMLGPKIAELKKQLASTNPPQWASAAQVPLMEAVKNLGNDSIHGGGTDPLLAQAQFDAELLIDIAKEVHRLLLIVYPDPDDSDSARRVVAAGAR